MMKANVALFHVVTKHITPLEMTLIKRTRTDPAGNHNRLYVHNLLMFRWWGMELDQVEKDAINTYASRYGVTTNG